jgi:hypothetical protein
MTTNMVGSLSFSMESTNNEDDDELPNLGAYLCKLGGLLSHIA